MRPRTRPLNLAHRGARAVAPENTLAAFCAARELGADGVELDIFRCQSGELVVTHDDDLSVWSNGHGYVTETPLAALKELDFGAHFSPQFAGQEIPTLAEVIDTLGETMFINIEVKTLALRPFAEVNALSQFIAERNLYQHVLVSSFNPLVLYHLNKRDPQIATGLLFQFRFPFYRRTPFLKLQALHPESRLASRGFIRRAEKRGYQINTWTVNDPAEMHRFVELGVAGIITDYPDRLKQVLAEYPDYSLPPPVNRKSNMIGFH